jgi:hypothetical protein
MTLRKYRTVLALMCLVLATPLALGAASRATEDVDYSQVPGVVIDHQAASTGQYVGSPSLAILPDGTYVASHDLFGPKTPKAPKAKKTRVFVSKDRGKTWKKVATLDAFWSGLFVHRGQLYLMGVTTDYGHVAIRRSTDEGRTWTNPADAHSGLLLSDARYHTAPCPVIVHAGRVWRAIEDREGPGGWGSHFRSFVMSAPVDADLLEASNWARTPSLGRDPSWLDGEFLGWLEGNAVAGPDGHVVNILRVANRQPRERVAMIHISDDGRSAAFDPARDFVDFPGGAKKFTIRFDAKSKLYWSLVNYVPPAYVAQNPDRVRNTVALVSSPDLHAWTVRCVLLHHLDVKAHAFQYLDWQFDGDDLVAASRTAYDDGVGGANNYHNANFLTFHRFPHFRDMMTKDSVPVPTTRPAP